MALSYKKLWKLLIDRDMKKKDLQIAENVNTDILQKICIALDCDICDIVEIIKK